MSKLLARGIGIIAMYRVIQIPKRIASVRYGFVEKKSISLIIFHTSLEFWGNHNVYSSLNSPKQHSDCRRFQMLAQGIRFSKVAALNPQPYASSISASNESYQRSSNSQSPTGCLTYQATAYHMSSALCSPLAIIQTLLLTALYFDHFWKATTKLENLNTLTQSGAFIKL
jgi:hypothetical protein